MNEIRKTVPGTLMLGNESISRGALEARVSFAAGYPGTPSSEIIESLARQAEQQGVKENIYVEWSINEKVAAIDARCLYRANVFSAKSKRASFRGLGCDPLPVEFGNKSLSHFPL